ncbi:MAG: hypothetical protein J6S62_00930 [Bacteroidales bacterium]|nr:hypothetical protein [Bacteroidales bacterium]
MACFIVPLVQAVATSIYCKTAKNSISNPHSALLKRELPALEKMLWGGSVMLIVDHIINGELTWKFPFFTALGVEGGGAVMLREMLTVGLPISIAVTAVWAIYAVLKSRRSAVKA